MSWVKVKSPQNKISLIPHTALEVFTRYGYKELVEEKPTPQKPVEEPKVVVEETKGILSFMAIAFPQTAMESATIQSGRSCSISRETHSSSVSVVSTRILVENARSLPARTESFGVNLCVIS